MDHSKGNLTVQVPSTGGSGELHRERWWKLWHYRLLPLEGVLICRAGRLEEVLAQLAATGGSCEHPCV